MPLRFKGVHYNIMKLHASRETSQSFESSGVQRGDKIALAAATVRLGCRLFGRVDVWCNLLYPYCMSSQQSQIHNIVNHSDSKLLFVVTW
jgi:hypothetical protein